MMDTFDSYECKLFSELGDIFCPPTFYDDDYCPETKESIGLNVASPPSEASAAHLDDLLLLEAKAGLDHLNRLLQDTGSVGHGELTQDYSISSLSAPCIDSDELIRLCADPVADGTVVSLFIDVAAADVFLYESTSDDGSSGLLSLLDSEVSSDIDSGSSYFDGTLSESECDSPSSHQSKRKASCKSSKSRPKPYDIAIPKERKEKKKLQNKTAATRYRMKKKVEGQTLYSEEHELACINSELKEKVADLEHEIALMKEILRDVCVKS